MADPHDLKKELRARVEDLVFNYSTQIYEDNFLPAEPTGIEHDVSVTSVGNGSVTLVAPELFGARPANAACTTLDQGILLSPWCSALI